MFRKCCIILLSFFILNYTTNAVSDIDEEWINSVIRDSPHRQLVNYESNVKIEPEKVQTTHLTQQYNNPDRSYDDSVAKSKTSKEKVPEQTRLRVQKHRQALKKSGKVSSKLSSLQHSTKTEHADRPPNSSIKVEKSKEYIRERSRSRVQKFREKVKQAGPEVVEVYKDRQRIYHQNYIQNLLNDPEKLRKRKEMNKQHHKNAWNKIKNDKVGYALYKKRQSELLQKRKKKKAEQ
jgi:hypothetical protein